MDLQVVFDIGIRKEDVRQVREDDEDPWKGLREDTEFISTQFRSPHLNAPSIVSNLNSQSLKDYLCIASYLPPDYRIRLTFDLPWLWNYVQFKATMEGRSDAKEQQTTLDSIKLRMKGLEMFDEEMQRYGDFYIFDIFNLDNGPRTREYRLGGRPGRTPISRNPVNSFQRIIFCEGLSLAHKVAKSNALSALPYLVLNGQDDPIKRAVDFHLSSSQQESSEFANPYSNFSIGFHITFYEIVEKEGLLDSYDKWKNRETWKVGYLYEKSGALNKMNRLFRRSAFTILATSDCLKRALAANQQEPFERYWTILLLTPSSFFQRPRDTQSPLTIDFGSQEVLSKQVAELTLIFRALKEVAKRWTRLYDDIAQLLSEDFMEPKIYVRLIFDDESFTRSRLYFWVIGCLNEFLISIEDNIKQWKLFREARVTLLLKNLPKTDGKPKNAGLSSPYSHLQLQRLQSLDQSAEGVRENLENLRSRFKNQLETVKSLRDGLFNASALIESRASTKLGENVRLLTYVSIFYLPLAFCAALWAIPNINQGSTRKSLIITTIIVSFVTYGIVFNLENIARLSGRLYYHWRANLVQAMQEDSSVHWSMLGQRFEDFRPNNNHKRPSKWYIIFYQMRELLGRRKVNQQKQTREV